MDSNRRYKLCIIKEHTFKYKVQLLGVTKVSIIFWSCFSFWCYYWLLHSLGRYSETGFFLWAEGVVKNLSKKPQNYIKNEF